MISLSKMKEWFENETENSVKKIRADIKKRIDYIDHNLEELKVAAQDFEVGDTVDAESRSSQNIFEKMTEMVDEFDFPEEITYKTAEEFLKKLGKFLSRVLTLGKRFIPNLKKKYRTRVFVLNRALERAQKNYKDFEIYLEQKTVLLKDVDSTSEDITILIDKVSERENIKQEIKSTTKDETNLGIKIKELDTSISSLDQSGILKELEEINNELKVINNKLKLELGGLDKPLRKLAARYLDGKVQVPPHLIELSNNIRDNPEKALEDIPEGHSELNDLLEILVEAMKKDKLKLKTSMNNKATNLANAIMNGKLKDLHSELLSFALRRKELEQKIDDLGLREQLQQIRMKQEELEKETDRKRRRKSDLEEKLDAINKEIVDLAADTQRKIRKLTNQDVKINITE
ncbi:MAG: hypothetical protein FK733_15505 [Asgard group archaeon]|nr:hypothetical protein [Asgard group archaeon]